MTQDLFIPCYNNGIKWMYYPYALSEHEANLLLQDHMINQYTTLIPFSCTMCPKWLLKSYAVWKLTLISKPKSI